VGEKAKTDLFNGLLITTGGKFSESAHLEVMSRVPGDTSVTKDSS
jgi:hypothetical protein